MNNPSVTIDEEMFKPLFPILCLSKFMCLQPLKWKKSDFSYCLTKSWIYLGYSYFVTICMVTAGIYGLFKAYELNFIYSIKAESSTGFWVKIIDVTVIMSNFITGVIVTSYKINTYLNYFHHVAKADYLLQKRSPQTYQYSTVTVATVLIVLIIFTYDLVLGVQMGSKSEGIVTILAYFFPFYVAYFSIFVIELVYWQLVYSIKVRLVLVNENLREICGNKAENFFVKNDKRVINNLVDTLKIDSSQKKMVESTTLERFVDLIKAYESLTEAARTVNESYGLIMAIVLLGCLVHLLVSPYSLRNVLMLKQGNPVYIIPQFMWVSLHISRLMLIIEPCHGCLQQLKETSFLVCKLRLSNYADGEFRRAMDFFLSFLSQNKIEFSVFGMAVINRNLLPGIAGAVTTYLVILFQFQDSY